MLHGREIKKMIFEKKKMETGTKEKRIYIAGPISGRDRVDYIQHFAKAEEYLEDKGYTVINPAKTTAALPDTLSHGEYMEICLTLLSLCDSIYMLEGWEKSLGASMEYGYAQGKDMKIIFEVPKGEHDGVE